MKFYFADLNEMEIKNPQIVIHNPFPVEHSPTW